MSEHWSMRDKLVLFEGECDCEPGVFLKNGKPPEYITDYGRALKAERDHRRNGNAEPYWAVHLNGKHVLGIVGEDD